MNKKKHQSDNSGQSFPDNGKKLLEYLQGNLSDADAHDLEMHAEDHPLWADALEGLQDADPGKLNDIRADINRHMRKRIRAHKETRRKKKSATPIPHLWLFVAIVLLLALLAFWAVKNFS